MARYVDTALSAGEPILYDAKVHWAIFLQIFSGLWIYAVFGLIGYFALGANTLSNIIGIVKHFEFLSWLHNLTPKLLVIATSSLVICLIIGLNVIHSLVYYYNSDFVLTDRRVISKFGLLSRTTSEQRLSKVESIHVHQSFLGRLLNYGTVTVTGTGSSTTTFGPMMDPIACKRAIEAQLDLVKPVAG